MKYTVKKFAKLSGISVRTLHWYDEIGLLKPAYYSANGYRHYEEEQLHLLKQILFFRELGFALKDIQKMLPQNNLDKLMAMNVHKAALEDSVNRGRALIDTIDKTYAGLDAHKLKESSADLDSYYSNITEDYIHKSKKPTRNLADKESKDTQILGNEIYKALAECLNKRLEPKSPEAQALIHKHYQMTEGFYYASKELYLGLAQLYAECPGFHKFFNIYHPKLTKFIVEAMRLYAQNNLS